MRLDDIFNESLFGRRPEGPDLVAPLLADFEAQTQPYPGNSPGTRMIEMEIGNDEAVVTAKLGRSRYRNPNAWAYLTNLMSHPAMRRKGHGKMAMEMICSLADKHGVGLELQAEPLKVSGKKMNEAQLMTWYATFGFEAFGAGMMYRKPDPEAWS